MLNLFFFKKNSLYINIEEDPKFDFSHETYSVVSRFIDEHFEVKLPKYL